MFEMFYRFTGSDPRLLTEIGARRNSGIYVAGATRGTALYGPYVSLPAGKYEAVVHFDPGAPCRGQAVIDACAGSGRSRLMTHSLSAAQIAADGMKARVQFSSPEPLDGVEVRLFVDGELSVGVSAVEIYCDPVDSDKCKFQYSDLPHPRSENAVRNGRNVFEGYQRQMLTEKDRARVILDPDYRRARGLAGERTIVSETSLINIFLLIKFFAPKLSFGHIVEFGSYRGGSAIFMAALAERFLPGTQVIAFDTFAGMPETDRSVDEHQRGDFSGVDLSELNQYVKRIGLRNLEYVQGLFEDTAPPVLKRRKNIVLCHIDCDIRSSIEYAYDVARPYMEPSGYWVFDDLLSPACLGAVEAVEDILIKRDRLNSEQIVPHFVFRQPRR